jgi:hypothetical protein
MAELTDLTDKYQKLSDLTIQSRLPDIQFSFVEAAQDAKLEIIEAQTRAKMKQEKERGAREASQRSEERRIIREAVHQTQHGE